MRLHPFQDSIEIVRVHLDEFPFFEFGKGLFGLSGKITQDAHNER
jgi:hypothetical protein